MRNQRGLAISLIIFGIFLILFIVWYLFLSGNKKDVVEQNSNIEKIDDQDREIDMEEIIKEIEEEDLNLENKKNIKINKVNLEELGLKRIAISFTERFGSFSNQANFSNLIDSQIFMSQKMIDWSNDFIRKNQKGAIDSDYSAIITKAISVKIDKINLEGGYAIVSVNTKRIKKGNKNKTEEMKKISLIFKRESQEWKVDQANWLEN